MASFLEGDPARAANHVAIALVNLPEFGLVHFGMSNIPAFCELSPTGRVRPLFAGSAQSAAEFFFFVAAAPTFPVFIDTTTRRSVPAGWYGRIKAKTLRCEVWSGGKTRNRRPPRLPATSNQNTGTLATLAPHFAIRGRRKQVA